MLAAQGRRVVVPFLRGYGGTRFLSKRTKRNGQQSALAFDAVKLMDALKIADGSRVAEIGAGGGWFTVRLAHRVNQSGIVYSEDVQPEMIEAIRRREAG